MDKLERAQVRLLLEHLNSEFDRKSEEQHTAMIADHAAKCELQSGATVKGSLRIVETVSSDYVKAVVSAVSDVSQDTEAFGMMAVDLTNFLRTLKVSVDQAVALSSGGASQTANYPSVAREADRLFGELQQRVLRLLEIHRFTFTKPSRADGYSPHRESGMTEEKREKKNPGGKPLAAHWDDMWSTIAVQIYVGDLQPKTQADVERAMLAWFAERDLEIGETAIRERARHLWRKFETAR